MKERVEKAILDDEMRVIIQSLIEKANQKGYGRDYVINSIKDLWNEAYPRSKMEEIIFSEDEEKFFDGAERFVEDFSNTLIKIIKDRNYFFMEPRYYGIESTCEYLNSIKNSICAIYCTFKRELVMRQEIASKKYMRLFGKCDYFGIIVHVLDVLLEVYLDFHQDGSKPTVKQEKNSFYMTFNDLCYNKSFIDFQNRLSYRGRYTFFVRTSFEIIWFIQTYYS